LSFLVYIIMESFLESDKKNYNFLLLDFFHFLSCFVSKYKFLNKTKTHVPSLH